MRELLLLSILCCLFYQCLEPFDFEFEEETVEKILVVDGVLSNSPGPHKVTLSRTESFGNKFIDPVTNAKVLLNGTEEFLDQGNGEYILDNYTPQIGAEYFLSLTLSDGTQYSSNSLIMPVSIKPDSNYVKYESDIFRSTTGAERITTVMNVYLDTPLPDNDNNQNYYLRWLTEGLSVFPEESCGGLHIPKTCYISEPPKAQNIRLQSSENISGNRLIEQPVARKSSYTINEFKTLYVFSTYQYSITKESYEYWSDLKTLANQSGTVFDLPPAALQGNIKNDNDDSELVLGFFDVAAVDTVRVRVIASEFRKNISGIVPCSNFSRRNWPEECCQCLVLGGANLERPAWLN